MISGDKYLFGGQETFEAPEDKERLKYSVVEKFDFDIKMPMFTGSVRCILERDLNVFGSVEGSSGAPMVEECFEGNVVSPLLMICRMGALLIPLRSKCDLTCLFSCNLNTN